MKWLKEGALHTVSRQIHSIGHQYAILLGFFLFGFGLICLFQMWN